LQVKIYFSLRYKFQPHLKSFYSISKDMFKVFTECVKNPKEKSKVEAIIHKYMGL